MSLAEAQTVTTLRALLAESVGLWGAGHRVLSGNEGRIILQGEAGLPTVTVEPCDPSSGLTRWIVAVDGEDSVTRPQPCSSVLGVLDAVRDALGVPSGASSALRLGLSPREP
ncbi:hypothetical protein [Bradyrhizobium sp. LHD-71]|uniref:hypothetical protein n=1 Tax=Bradyrhizobium sp. LHD-71 TaxID=3072141 RepID=UPI00280EEC87|nr:hypothetical protein [Bradyrhizobium sp. LHD-71]MDQ8729283.1 hypothetical protein [Bradyrhizobium sp. LHD-71]